LVKTKSEYHNQLGNFSILQSDILSNVLMPEHKF